MYRLLIADDEKIEKMVLYKTIQKSLGNQCQIFEADNGREALEVYEREQIQIAVLDIEMPGINGIQAAEQIRKKDRECCIIFLTAFDEFSYAKKAIAVRALDYLLKPYEENELISVLEEAMRLVDESKARKQFVTDHSEKKASEKEPVSRPFSDMEGRDMAAESEIEEDVGGTDRDSSNTRLYMVSEKIEEYIKENYRQDISMQDAARAMNYSETYFCKLFKQCFGKNFTSYLTEYRVTEAKKLLIEPMANVRDIGKAVGYGDSNYFAKVFKRITGHSPTEYRMNVYKDSQQ